MAKSSGGGASGSGGRRSGKSHNFYDQALGPSRYANVPGHPMAGEQARQNAAAERVYRSLKKDIASGKLPLSKAKDEVGSRLHSELAKEGRGLYNNMQAEAVGWKIVNQLYRP